MQSRLVKAGLVSLAFVLAVTCALLSVLVERTGPELVQYGDLCGPNHNDPCYQAALKGGFPFAYLFDAPGVSRERRLAFGEDTLRAKALVLDISVYFAVILLAGVAISRGWFANIHARKHGDA